MENLKSKTLNFRKATLITAFLILFVLLATYLRFHTFLSLIPDEINGISVWGNVWKVTWTGLAFIFITYYNHQLPISISEMFDLKK